MCTGVSRAAGDISWCGRVTIALLVFAFPTMAWAHAVLLGSFPAADQVLDSAPAEIELNFNENVGPIFIKVLDTSGAEVGNLGDWRVDGNDVFQPLAEILTNGTYILTYRVISADTHPVGSTFVFAVGEPIQDMSESQATGGDTGWSWLVAGNRVLLYASVLLAAGSALLVLFMRWPASLWTGISAQGRVASAIAAFTYLLSVGLGGAEMLMGSAGALFSLDTWRQGLSSTLLPSALIGIPGTLVLMLAFSRNAASTPLLLLGTSLSIGGFLVTGHAATAPPVSLMALAVAVHLVCGAFWFAALRPLWLSTRTEPLVESGRLMRVFSTRAVWSVGALFASGVIIGYVQVESFDKLVSSAYGVRLLLKVALFLLLLAIAAVNKNRHTPRLEVGDPQAADAMRRSIRIEYGLMVAVLVAAVSLTLPSPPRSAAAMAGNSGMDSTADTSVAVGENRGYTARAEISPGRTGQNMVMFSFTDGSGTPVEIQRVVTIWSLPSASLEGVEREAEKISPMMFHLMTDDLILPGTWQLTVSAYVDDFTKINIPVSVDIR